MRGRWDAALVLLGSMAASTAAGCAAARSDSMRPVIDALPLVAPPDAALVVFVRHDGSAAKLYTVMDEEKHFLGDSAVRSRFAVTLPSGDHVFIAWDDSEPGANAFTFELMGATTDPGDLPRIEPLQATLSRGKVYLVEVGANGTLRPAPPAAGDQALAGTSAFAPDVPRGQARLDRAPMRLERIRQRAVDLLAGYRYGDVELHTLRAKDGR